MFYDYTMLLCMKCMDGCQKCNSYYMCDMCYSWKLNYVGMCWDYCPVGY